MIKNKAEKDLKGAIVAWAETENLSPNNIGFMVGLKKKQDLDGDKYTPFYFIKRDGKIVYQRDENGIVVRELGVNKIKEVSFNDILRVKFDFMNRGMLVGNFLKQEIKKYAEKFKISPIYLYVEITTKSQEIKKKTIEDITIVLWVHKGYEGTWWKFERYKELTLEEVFKEEDLQPENAE